jgi:O-acetyl-ADP-ribose deacetylase (regulator of RNase III)
MISVKRDSILNATETYICQQCNCKTQHGLGLSKALFDKFPYADIYSIDTERKLNSTPGKINIKGNGTTQRFIINMMGQNYPGKPNSYETKEKRQFWFKQCLDEISKHVSHSKCSIAFPHNIGCNLAGGSWAEYYSMLQIFNKQNPNIDVVIYEH